MMKSDNKNYFKTNKETWNKKVALHAKSAMYDVESFKKGKSSLNKYELDELKDVKGKSMLHLQCHFGQDTLSWSRLGAKCTGVDISDEGINLAISLNKELGYDAKFVCCNVYDINNYISDKFDIIFTSYGVVGWLPDLTKWANLISSRLIKGGTFYMVEFHPIVWMFDYLEGKPLLKYPYLNKDVIYEEYEGTYADKDAKIISKEYGWNHGLGEVVSSLIAAGLKIEFLHEFEESPYNVFPELKETKSGMYKLQEGKDLFPLVYSIKATKL